jgi:hypothetical protein
VLAALTVEEDDGTAADAARRRTSHAVFEPVLVDRMAMLFDSVLCQSSEILLRGLSQSYSPSFVIESEPNRERRDGLVSDFPELPTRKALER